MKFYRVLFGLAFLYNATFGLWASLFPNHFFSLLDLPPPLYPSLWACLGMVVGLYGLLYAHAAWKPEEGDFLIWVGLLGKVLGPIGWLMTIWKQELPPRTIFLILANDLIWWFPFLFYLLRHRRSRNRILTAVVVAVHGVACLGLLVAGGGTEIEPDMAKRLQWVRDHVPLWSVVWFFWIPSSLGFLAFAAFWSQALRKLSPHRIWIAIACALAAIGVSLDLSGELINIAWLTNPARSLDQFSWGPRAYLLLSAVGANGLYCAGGMTLSVLSWKAKLLRGPVAVLGFLMWTVGLGLTATAWVDHRVAIVGFGTLTMLLFIPWAGLTGWRLEAPRS